MTRGQAWTVHLAAAGVGGTGLVYAWMRYLCVPEDELALVNHPLQPSVQHLHLWLAPLLVFGVGLLWSEHAWARVRSGFPVRRPTGLVLFAIFWPMVVSGVAVQVVADERARTIAVWSHVVSGVFWVLAYVLHMLTRRGKTGPSPASTARSSRAV
jgi:hypothetical protein